ncbi:MULTISPECIES: exopolysaccharide biosynthesis polyprenyl glycosylphosphotransferase [unclassified Caulobacter]|uniref:exopolysaccharide biosynthesis polyprenyl glycosylphosphotransferase n=1 Tax=unclassified Caulobacter TaxID=2648921 RepID=UPI0006F2BB74|nr:MULTISPECIES: exopolysaccharide biosynthesis polyprenyl glycosylphosphotransferase [unclassified Caulobacter]KQV58724.1 exopolysaccharide biosynthesis protein [Caulobacter sp. Root342]KQV68767.1 exopolysaccharide biosynthesis protein [Caulobacter sp. Root343]
MLVISNPSADQPGGALSVLPVAQDPLKRALDIVVAGGALLFFAPLLALVAILIKLESRGPVLFRQARGGLNGQAFTIFKFRSMRVQENGDKVVQAKRDDDRITTLGRILRKTSIDELPQLLNVLKGDMSIVGPRPHALAHDDQYGPLIANYHLRFRARPGLTGLAQIKGLRGGTSAVEAMAARVDADNDYIDDWSIWSDVRILALTLPHLLLAENAY